MLSFHKEIFSINLATRLENKRPLREIFNDGFVDHSLKLGAIATLRGSIAHVGMRSRLYELDHYYLKRQWLNADAYNFSNC